MHLTTQMIEIEKGHMMWMSQVEVYGLELKSMSVVGVKMLKVLVVYQFDHSLSLN